MFMTRPGIEHRLLCGALREAKDKHALARPRPRPRAARTTWKCGATRTGLIVSLTSTRCSTSFHVVLAARGLGRASARLPLKFN